MLATGCFTVERLITPGAILTVFTVAFKDHGHALWEVPQPIAGWILDDLTNVGWICLNYQRAYPPCFDCVPLDTHGLWA